MNTEIQNTRRGRGRPRRDEQPYSPLERRVVKVLHNIEGRCTNPAVNRFEYYGGRGIKNFLTLADLVVLWERDGAGKMFEPSIDRENSDLDYTVENCRFVEFADNRKRADHRQVCSNCQSKVVGIRSGLCRQCTTYPCLRCGEPRPKGSQTVCDDCRYETRPCAWCSEPITRDTATDNGHGTIKNKQWFCSKSEFGKWLAAKYGFGAKKDAA